MNHTPAEIIAQIISEDSGSYPVFISEMPDGTGVADGAFAVYDTAGRKLGRLASLENMVQYGIQIKVRALGYSDAYLALQNVIDLFGALHNQEVEMDSGNVYTIELMIQSSTILSLGQDQRRRASLTVNYLVVFKETTT